MHLEALAKRLFRLSQQSILLLAGIGILRIVALAFACLELKVTVRLHGKRTFYWAHPHLNHRSDEGHIDYLHLLGQFLGCGESDIASKEAKATPSVITALVSLVADIPARNEFQVVACLYRNVLTLDRDIAVRSADSDTGEGIDVNIAPRGFHSDITFVGRARYFIDTIFIRQLEATFEGLALF